MASGYVKKYIRKNRRRLWLNSILLLVMLLSNAPYSYMNRPILNLVVMKTPLDDMVPFVPLFAVFYIPVFYALFSLATAIAFFKKGLFRPFAFSVIAVNLISYFLFFLVQTYVQRSEVTGTDIFSNMVRYTYERDAPYNTFPSLHVAMSAVMAVFFYRIKPAYGRAALLVMALVALSTLFLRQHYTVDVVFGAALGFSAYAMFSNAKHGRLHKMLS